MSTNSVNSASFGGLGFLNKFQGIKNNFSNLGGIEGGTTNTTSGLSNESAWTQVKNSTGIEGKEAGNFGTATYDGSTKADASSKKTEAQSKYNEAQSNTQQAQQNYETAQQALSQAQSQQTTSTDGQTDNSAVQQAQAKLDEAKSKLDEAKQKESEAKQKLDEASNKEQSVSDKLDSAQKEYLQLLKQMGTPIQDGSLKYGKTEHNFINIVR